MAFTPISRQPKLPIIDGFVVVPDIDRTENLLLSLSDALSAIPGSTVLINPFVTDNEQNLYVLPEFDRENRFPEDFYATLRAAAS